MREFGKENSGIFLVENLKDHDVFNEKSGKGQKPKENLCLFLAS
jgi:hypothetical protein